MIKIQHLVKNYGSNCAVDDISFEVGEGEIVGFLGPNGAGKSTTMNILTGYLSSTSGKAYIGGIDMLQEPLKAKKLIGYLPEQPPLYLDMTVEEFLIFNYELKGCTLNKEKHIADICDIVKISDVRQKLIKSLSKGYRQRVGIAQALVGNPKVLIFDEPTVGLDPKQIIEIRNLIRGLGKKHTVILSTHILQEVQAVCDRIIIINKGKIVANEKTENIASVVSGAHRFHIKVVGPQKEVFSFLSTFPGVTYCETLTERDGEAVTYLVESAKGTDLRKNLFYQLADKKWPIVGLEMLGVNLEDIFLSVVSDQEKEGKETRYTRDKNRARNRVSPEKEFAKTLVADAKKQSEEATPSEED